MKTKYQYDKKAGYYYTYLPTDELYANGKPKYKKIRAKTIAKIDEKIREYEENKRLNINPSNITVDEWYNQWLKAYKTGCADNTHNYYASIYKTHLKYKIGAIKVNQIKETHLQLILNEMSVSGKAKSTINGVKKMMFSLFDKAVVCNIIAVNPAKNLTVKGKPKKERRALTANERILYLDACQNHPFGTAALFLYYLGLRRGELFALTKSDIHDETITINKQYIFPNNNQPFLSLPKTENGIREVPIPKALRKAVDFSKLNDGLLFCRDDGQPYSYTEIRNQWKSFITSALGNKSEITMHYLRHNYCCMLFEVGVPPITVKEIVGHESIETTLSIYTHFTETMRNNDYKKLDLIS